MHIYRIYSYIYMENIGSNCFEFDFTKGFTCKCRIYSTNFIHSQHYKSIVPHTGTITGFWLTCCLQKQPAKWNQPVLRGQRGSKMHLDQQALTDGSHGELRIKNQSRLLNTVTEGKVPSAQTITKSHKFTKLREKQEAVDAAWEIMVRVNTPVLIQIRADLALVSGCGLVATLASRKLHF